MKVVVINPPLVQLNAPYPSGAYLSAFFKEMGCETVWKDLSIELFEELFSSSGLTQLFNLTEQKALDMALKAYNQGDEATAYNLRRYISTKDFWINWIGFITQALKDGSKDFSTREKEHEFLYSPFAPRGSRMESFLANLEKEPTVDDVRFLCSYALADLADYITAVFDNDFSLIRYAEFVASESRTLKKLEQQLNAPVLREFYQKVLEREFVDLEGNEKTLICISIPFAGTYIPAMYTARYFKQKFGDKVFVVIGGGFVNTDLRKLEDPGFGKYIDAISYDRGYGSYKELLDGNYIQKGFDCSDVNSFYKLAVFCKSSDWNNQPEKIKLLSPLWEKKECEDFEKLMTEELVPDYSAIDFSRYLRVCDDKNSMHRLWTDGTWIKAYLAHGCYWHKCLFCDTKLDYVCGYHTVKIDKLFAGLLNTAKEKNLYGIHFVDEALPPKGLKRFGLLNAKNNKPLYFWGNVRFEKSFTKDLAAFLSYCGLGAVSAGIEVATGTGLKNINKGTDIDSIVSACAAFKEAGILVHAYMIYGFWYDTPQTIIDSMETLRQFFVSGLLDSAFWHKFMFTQNSEAYEKYGSEEKKLSVYEKYGAPLETALNSWMHGEKLDMKVTKWFDFPMPNPSISRDYIEKAIEKYERKNESVDFSKGEVFWLGSNPIESGNELYWYYLQEEQSLSCGNIKENLAEILWQLRPESSDDDRKKALNLIEKSSELMKKLKQLHNFGIVVV